MVFDEYAQYYDLLYQNKDYQGEAAYIDSLLQKYGNHPVQILELGCGTGRHAQLLAQKGYIMQGLDMSEEMLQQARPRGGMLVTLCEPIYAILICNGSMMRAFLFFM